MTIRAQVTLGSGTGLPEDAVVNVFHFGPIGAMTLLQKEAAAADIIQFYTVAELTQVAAVGAYLSPSLSRTAGQGLVEIFDLEDAPPRVPSYTETFTLPASTNANGLPDEVAIAISWRAQAVSGANMARRRGRNFIGPLNISVAQTVLGQTRPSGGVLADFALAGDALISSADSELVIFSEASPLKVPPQAANAAYSVTNGYVDNAFDTIRSRGHAPTSRVSFAR